ncbi:recombinase family protein [Nocardia sp. NPDC057030]|uniref:recombinase family protein n=1 Tax=unclassified Nocardia TaxID=2637762 RepID=UPI0036262A1A
MTRRSRRSAAEIVRAIIYARVSKDEGRRGRSCKEQVDACLSDCEYEGWAVPLPPFVDNDRGATRYSKGTRVQFAALWDVLGKGDVLVVWEPSRITREPGEFSKFADMCGERGVLLYYDERLWDLNDDDDRNQVWQDIIDAAKAAAKTRKRTKRAIDANIVAKKPHGKRAPGYRIVRDADGNSIGREVDPLKQRVLVEAAERVLPPGLESASKVAKDLQKRWRDAGGKGSFAGRDLTRFLTNPTLFGLYHHEGVIDGKGDWPALLPLELFDPLRAILLDGSRLTHQGSENKWWLTYIARCGKCLEMGEPGIIGRKLVNKRGKRFDQYVCQGYFHVARGRPVVDAYVEELLMQLLEHPDTLAKLSAKDAEDRSLIDAELETIERLTAAKKGFLRDAAKRLMSADAVADYVEPIEADIREAQKRVTALTRPVDPVLADAIGPDARRTWAERSIVQKRAVVRAAMTITIVPVGGGRHGRLGVEARPVKALAG